MNKELVIVKDGEPDIEYVPLPYLKFVNTNGRKVLFQKVYKRPKGTENQGEFIWWEVEGQ